MYPPAYADKKFSKVGTPNVHHRELNKIFETYLVLNETAHSNVQSTGV